MQLVHRVLKDGLVSKPNVLTVELFVKDILRNGYKTANGSDLDTLTISSFVASRVKSIYYWPSSIQRQWSEHPFKIICASVSTDNDNNNDEKQPTQLPRNTKDTRGPAPIVDIVLVVVFKVNDAQNQMLTIPYMDFMYGQHFKVRWHLLPFLLIVSKNMRFILTLHPSTSLAIAVT